MGEYSSYYYDPWFCPASKLLVEPDWVSPDEPQTLVKKFKVLTDGTCGSTCRCDPASMRISELTGNDASSIEE